MPTIDAHRAMWLAKHTQRQPIPGEASTEGMHSITWQDDGMVGVKCNKDPGNVFVIDSQSENPKACDACGKRILLVWMVSLEEVE